MTEVDVVPCKKVTVLLPQTQDADRSALATIEEQASQPTDGDASEALTELQYPKPKKGREALTEYHRWFVEHGRVVTMSDDFHEKVTAAIGTLKEKWSSPKYVNPPTYKEDATKGLISTCANKPITLDPAPAEVWTKTTTVKDGSALHKMNEQCIMLAKDRNATRKVREALDRGEKAQDLTITEENWLVVKGRNGDNVKALKEMIPGLEVRCRPEMRLDEETKMMRTVVSLTAPAQENLDLAIALIESVDAVRFQLFISKARVGEVCSAVRALTSCQKIDYRRRTGVWTLIGVAEARTQAEAAIHYWKDHKRMPDQPQSPPQWELQRTQLRGSGGDGVGAWGTDTSSAGNDTSGNGDDNAIGGGFGGDTGGAGGAGGTDVRD